MAKKGGENSKKAAGNARKADAAARKQAEAEEANEQLEESLWEDGSKKKGNKKDDAAAKKEEARRKKAEREAQLELEEAEAAFKKPQNTKNKGRDKILARRGGIDDALSASEPGLSARNIDDAISALEITTGKGGDKIDRHPERRFKAALKAYEDARLPDLRQEHPGLRLNQYKELMYKEFQKSPDNPFNQVNVSYNASQNDVSSTAASVRRGKEDRLKTR